jgi:hypothetical protein
VISWLFHEENATQFPGYRALRVLPWGPPVDIIGERPVMCNALAFKSILFSCMARGNLQCRR